MKAIRLDQPGQFARIDLPEPPAPAAGEAVVRVHRIGICGTDYGGYLGKMPFYSYPRIPGHELGVEVLAVGPGVTNVKPGDRCSVEPYINCQTCYSCRRGFTNCCENHQTLGVMCDGGMAEKFLLPARKLHISTKLSYDQLALQFSLQHPDIATTVSGSANPVNIRNWAKWAAEPIDQQLLAEVQAIFAPVKNLGHLEGLKENN